MSGGWHGNVPTLIVSINDGYTQRLISEQGCFSANLATLDMIDMVNFCGFYSGENVDKGAVIPHVAGRKLPVPVINASPLAFECSIIEKVELEGIKTFIARIDNFWIEESLHDSFSGALAGNTLDAARLNLIVSCLDAYYALGAKVDVCRKP